MFSFLRNYTLTIKFDAPTVTLLNRALDIWEGKAQIAAATATLVQTNAELAAAFSAVNKQLKTTK